MSGSSDTEFQVPDLDLPPPRPRAAATVAVEASVYEASDLDAVPFLEACGPVEESNRRHAEEIPRVTHVDQAIFDAAAAPETVQPAVTATARCPRCMMPIALHAGTCPHCTALVMPIRPFAARAIAPLPSEPVTFWSRVVDVLATIPYDIWKRSAGYTFLICVLGNACTCRPMSVAMNIVCALVIAISFIGIGACVRSQRSP